VKDKKKGAQTLAFRHAPVILASSSIVGPMEGKGPLGEYFDEVRDDQLWGQKTWEKAESKLVEDAVLKALQKAGIPKHLVDFLFAGDLLNQITVSNFAAGQLSIPFFGVYGACSTFAEAICLGAMTIDGGYAGVVVAAASSHHDTAERQYRYPTEFGVQRPPTAQWTATAAGAALLAGAGDGPRVTYATVGKVVDFGIRDPNNMGAAMAPAAADTIRQHLHDTGRSASYYDLIVTGDLGRVGLPLAQDTLKGDGIEAADRFADCGILLYSEEQDVHAGGSGCGCSAAVFGGYLMQRLEKGDLKKILLVATGALHSPMTYLQGENIPAVAHAVAIERP
jgi:stage V sporulation protein AD